MSKWEMVRLEEICTINMGQSPKSDSYNEANDGIPFYQGNADFGLIHPSVKYYCNKPTKIATRNDVLLSVRAPIGALNIANEECCIGRGLCALSEKKDISYYKFIFYILKYKNAELNSMGTGSTFKAINKKNLSNIEVMLPSLDVQMYMSHTLDKVAEIINLHKKRLEELDNLIKSTFYDMFGDPVRNEKEWKVGKLGDTLSILTDYHSNGSYETLRDNVQLLDTPDYALMIRTTDLEKGNFLDGVKYISEHAYEHLKKSKVFGGEIIINKIGSAGKVYLMPYLNRPVSLAMNQFLLRFNNVNQVYAYHYLTTEYSTKNIKDKVRGAVTKTITKDAIRNIKFALPPIDLQNKFAQIVTKIEEQKILEKQAISESENLFNSLMSKYFD